MKFLTRILVCLMAGSLLAEEIAQAEVAQAEIANLTGAACELDLARIAIEKESYPEALRHLARIHTFHYREVEWLPAALFYEALIDERMGAAEKKFSALDELKALYPTSPWCQRAEKELIQKETEKGVLE